ncbi:hypothetical protein PI124_g23523 [Phytophthora idaei]|nr:hypothetical protein PI125_g25668 [Phytophthora idaei]KAG3123768.1 hypothetical protein PI126_g23558 [Phytophthora idaei]KAG3231381.1 hypothetical protein PI124_g23523 [Phytophthora idaei]
MRHLFYAALLLVVLARHDATASAESNQAETLHQRFLRSNYEKDVKMPLDADEERAKSNPLRNTLTVARKRTKAKPQQAPAEISSVEYNTFLSIFKSIKGKDTTPNVVAMLGKLKNPEQIVKYNIFYKAITSKT